MGSTVSHAIAVHKVFVTAPGLLGPKPEKRRALIFSLGFFFFFDYPGIFGGLNMVKTLENLHTHWNPRQLGRR